MATVCDRGGRAYGSSNWTALLHRRFLLEWGYNVYLACVHFTGISWSPAGDRVTAPRRCRLAELSGCLSLNYLQVPRVSADSLIRLRRVLDSNCQTVSQDCCLDTMATGNSPPGDDRTEIDFQVRSHGTLRRHM